MTNIKRLGLIAVVLAVSIFGIEFALSVLRQRTIDLTVRLEGTPPAIAGAASAGGDAPAPDTPESAAAQGSLIIAPDNAVVIDVAWRYWIGPRFPITTLRAEITDSAGESVAAEQYVIDCSNAGSFQCDGQQPMALRFGVRDGQGSAAPWPIGAYQLRVTRTYAGIAPAVLVSRPMVVGE